jgi:hypothetical protein
VKTSGGAQRRAKIAICSIYDAAPDFKSVSIPDLIRFVSTTEVSVIVSAMQRVLHDTVKAHVLEHRNCRDVSQNFKVGCIEEVLYTSLLMTREMLVNKAFRCSIPNRSFEELTKLAVKEILP